MRLVVESMKRPGLKGAQIRLPGSPDTAEKVTMTYRVDESTLAKLKLYHIWPSAVIRRELRREIGRRERAAKQKARKQVVNRYSGEVLTTE